ncbi:MAG TPA: nucleoside hydrolase [Nitrososphaerales archaeon]|nr:nucleoside hydrolase [Nitrososphaerales archaeon]
MKIILDMDPGIDDAVALLIALNNPKLDILAVTAANGNVDVNKSTYNALRIIEAVGKKATVARGVSKPLFKQLMHSRHVHGRDGLGNSDLPKPLTKPNKISAVRLIESLVKTHKRKDITIVATAPLTNIATLLTKDPSIATKLNKIVLMGGMYNVVKNARGNVTPYAEFNFYCDPEAAQIVLNSGTSIVAAGLDVTMNFKSAIRKVMLRRIRMLGGRYAETASRILEYQISRRGISHIHDVFAVASLLHPNMFRFVNCRVNVEKSGKYRGECVIDSNNDRVKVCSHVDHKRFLSFVLEGLIQRES